METWTLHRSHTQRLFSTNGLTSSHGALIINQLIVFQFTGASSYWPMATAHYFHLLMIYYYYQDYIDDHHKVQTQFPLPVSQ